MYRSARFLGFAGLLLISFAGACAEEEPAVQATGHTEVGFDDMEVVLTEPYCDVCTAEDKERLVARSPMIASVVEIIDAASVSVDIAQFTFSVREIADAALRARDRGVTVRLAVDAGQDKPGTRARALKDAGLDVRFVAGKSSGGTVGLLHAKFVLADKATLLTGSNNFSSTGVSINEENAIIVRGAEHGLVLAFGCHFEAIWAADPGAAGACSNETAAFSPGSAPRKLIRDELRSATESIDVVMHHFNFTDLVKELRAAAERGVAVRVLLNSTTESEHKGAAWTALVKAGGRIRYKQVNADQAQLMHHKLAVIDGRRLINGSGNWSGSAFFNNYENFVVYRQPRVVQRFRELYHRLWTWSLSGDSLAAGTDAATQHAADVGVWFGSLHAHFAASHEGVELDDGKPQRLDDSGTAYDVPVGDTVGASAKNAFGYARERLDFLALSPHCRDDVVGDTEANMSEAGFAELVEAARGASDDGFVAMAGMEWSTNSLGNHVGIVGSRAAAKTERGRFDALYGEFLPGRELAGDIPILMLNHPKTFADRGEALKGSWDMVFGVNLLEVPKKGERNQKFNDFGIDDFPPLSELRASWIEGAALPDPAVVDATMKNVWEAARPYARLMEVTLGRGTELGSETPVNPSLVESLEMPGVIERRTRVHSDYDWFLTRGFRIAPVASHDNHYANWGSGHTSRTAVLAEGLRERLLVAALEQREAYASEDEDLEVRFYAERRVPMGGAIAWPHKTISAEVRLADPSYAGPFVVRVFHGRIGHDGVDVAQELTSVAAGRHELVLDVGAAGEHFFYIEVHETDADRMAWSAPIWVERF